MIGHRGVFKSYKSLATAFLLLCASNVFAFQGLQVVPKPGVYATDQLLSFVVNPNTRLTLFLNGIRLDDSSAPLLLYAEYGEEKMYRIKTELRSLDPESPLIASDVLEWKIDKKRPAVPSYILSKTEGGVQVISSSDEPVIIHYAVYHPFYRSVSRGETTNKELVFLPSGAVFCSYAVDLAGNQSNPSSVTPETGIHDQQPFSVVNPVSGSWANRQTLVIDSLPGTKLLYTLNGTDPVAQGIEYSNPVFIDAAGSVTVRLAAQDPKGTLWTETVLYTVNEKTAPLTTNLPSSNGVFEAGTFFEDTLPEGYTCTIGNPWRSGKEQKRVLFSVPEGIRRLYPITIRKERTFWRWVFAAGSENSSSPSLILKEDTVKTSNKPQPRLSFHDWHFMSIAFDSPVFYSHDQRTWFDYKEPVVLERTENSFVYWYAPTWDNGKVQSIPLPVKPQLSGIPLAGVTAEPVFLSVSESPYTLYYSVGSAFPPLQVELGDNAPVLASGLLLETPQGACEPYVVRILAVHDGVAHGELSAQFILDRKAPRAPSLGIPSSLTYSRDPVTIRVSGEDMIQVSINPPIFEHSDSSWVLTGDPDRSVAYTVSSFSVDRAGNKSPVTEQKITVDRNALYVDGGYSGSKISDGTLQAPFTNLDSALAVIKGTGSWRVSLTGSVRLDRPHSLQAKVSLTGSKAKITAGPNAVIRMYSETLELNGISITRSNSLRAGGGYAGNSGSLPLFEVVNGKILITNCTIRDTGAGSGTILRSEKSNIVCRSSHFFLSADEYACAVDTRNSIFYAKDSSFEVHSRIASGISITGGRTTLLAARITVSAKNASRAVESWGASIVINDVMLERLYTGLENADTAFWMDKNTLIVSEQNLSINGFKYPRKTGTR